MTIDQAKDVLLNYICCCKYGTSPVNCSDEECDFGKAIKTLCNRPQGDLISRDALLKRVDEEREYLKSRGQLGAEHILVHNFRDLIDNAPTVEPFEPDYVGAERLKARQRCYEEGYHYGMEIGKTLNPKIKQGEWIIVKDKKYGDNVKCPFCSKELAGTDLNFCCKCGAKLIGSEKMNGSADMGGEK